MSETALAEFANQFAQSLLKQPTRKRAESEGKWTAQVVARAKGFCTSLIARRLRLIKKPRPLK